MYKRAYCRRNEYRGLQNVNKLRIIAYDIKPEYVVSVKKKLEAK